MGIIVFIAFVTVPILEIVIFMEIGGIIGFWPTIGIIILTAMIGTGLLRHQGLATLGRVRASLEQNRFPVEEVFDGLCLLVAGVLLLTPGFFTDAVGFFLFVPVFRGFFRGILTRSLIASGRVKTHSAGFPLGEGPGTVIDGEFEDISADAEAPPPNAHPDRDPGRDPESLNPPKDRPKDRPRGRPRDRGN